MTSPQPKKTSPQSTLSMRHAAEKAASGRKPRTRTKQSKDALKRTRGFLRRFTTPLLPDDYTVLINPLWSSRELRGRIEAVSYPTDETVTLRIRPGWGVPVDFHAGQYIGIGVLIGGRYTWRSYSLTDAPETHDGIFTITVRAIDEGRMSRHLVNLAEPGMHIRLAAPAGDFHLTEPVPEKILFISAGTGITPIVAMLRSLMNREDMHDVTVIHSVRHRSDLLYAEVLEQVAAYPETKVILRITGEDTDEAYGPRISADDLETLVPDVRERVVYACGPQALLDSLETWAEEREIELRTERFTLDRASDATGGAITFAQKTTTVEADGATTILEAAESAGIMLPFGCRMGICQTCVQQLSAGFVHDLRTNETHEPGARIRTCVCVAAGDVTVDC